MRFFHLRLYKTLPFLRWLSKYNQSKAQSDIIAALIVTAMLIPQGMAYAMLAGLPPIMGLYASILPMMIYAIFGGSPTLAIGPVAIISIMVSTTLEPIFTAGTVAYIQAAWLLSLMSGGILLAFGLLRFGFIIHLISHPVIKSFIIASAVLIALSQLKLILNIPLQTNNLFNLFMSLQQHFMQIHGLSVGLSFSFIAWLLLCPFLFSKYLGYLGVKQSFIALMIKTVPLIVMILAIFIVQFFDLNQLGVKTIGEIPSGLPQFTLPHFNAHLIWLFLPSAFMIAMISFVEAISIAQATALKTRNHLDSNQELIALGLSNLSAGVSNGFPVTGSLSRTVVNAEAGAKTPLAGVLSSFGIIFISLYPTDAFVDLPLTVLAATILVSISKLIDFKAFYHTWQYSKADGIAMMLTFLGVLCINIETGLIVGILSAAFLLLWRMSRPHIAVVGLLQGTEHFRNVKRFQHAIRSSHVLSLRVDESLTFLNAHTVKNYIINQLSKHDHIKDLVIICSSMNRIDASALEMLEELHDDLLEIGIQLHFSEIKGFVMDKLQNSPFLQSHFKGQIFLTQYQALKTLDANFEQHNDE